MVSRPTLGPVAPVAPVSPTDLLAHMQQGSHGAPGTVETADVAGALTAAIGHVEQTCGPILATDVRVAAWHDGRQGSLLLTVPAAITAVTELVTPNGVDVASRLTAAAVDWAAGIVRLPQLDTGEWVVRVTTATTPERTAALRLATLIIAAHLAGARLVPLAGAQGSLGFAIPRRASDLMQPYTRPVVA